MNARIKLDVLIARICLVGVFIGLGVVIAYGYGVARGTTFAAKAELRADFLKNSLDNQTLQLASDELLDTLAASATYTSILSTAVALDPAVSVATLRAGLDVEITPQSNLIVITERGSTPARAAEAANAVAQAVTQAELQTLAVENAAREKPLRDEIANSQAQITSLQSQIGKLVAQLPADSADATTPAITSLQSQLSTEQQTQLAYETQLALLLTTELQQAPSVQVAQVAAANAATVQPNRTKLLGGGAAAGFAIGLLLAALITPRRLRLPWRARLSVDSGAVATYTVSAMQEIHATPLRPSPPVSDALDAELRPIWFELLTQMAARPLRLVVVTGLDEEANADQFASALATYAATAGQRVVLVDANLERPSVQSWFGGVGRPDLVELLTEAGNDWPVVHAALWPTAVPSLLVLPTIQTLGMQKTLLGSVAMERVIDALLREPADLVLISCPPLLAETGARDVAARAESVILVSSEQRVGAEKAERVTNFVLSGGSQAITLVITAPRQRVAPFVSRTLESVSRRVGLAAAGER